MFNALKRRLSRGTSLALLPFALFCFGCDDGDDGQDDTVDAGIPPPPEYTEGNWSAAQRGLAIDAEDLIVMPTPNGEITAQGLLDSFGLLVLNLPYHQSMTGCPQANVAAQHQPKAKAQEQLTQLRAKGLSFERVAVNVDLLNPTRTDLLSICQSSTTVRFDTPRHRQQVVETFEELARLPEVSHITVGMDMNRYYHVKFGGERRLDDYSNFVTLYHEVYEAVKQINPQIRVGPGISWSVLMLETAPQMLDERWPGTLQGDGLAPPEYLQQAVRAAAQRTVHPLLWVQAGRERIKKADFLAVGFVQNPNEAPFYGTPNPSDEAATLRYFQHAPLVAEDLPLVLPQIDWQVHSAGNANNKSLYLTLLKKALSHTEVEWAAWRRYSDIPELGGGVNPCAKYTARPDPTLNYDVDYCYAGLVNQTGQVRDVFYTLTR